MIYYPKSQLKPELNTKLSGHHSVVRFIKSSFTRAKGANKGGISNPYVVGQGTGGMEFEITWQPGMTYTETPFFDDKKNFLGKRIRIVKENNGDK